MSMLPPSRVKLGRAAELHFQATCLRAGLDVFTPVTEDGRMDLLVGLHRYRCQVKVMGVRLHATLTRYMVVVKSGGRSKRGGWYRYTADDVDFMVGVDTDTWDVFIVPIAATSLWKNAISETALLEMGTRDAYHLLAAAPGTATVALPPSRVSGRRPNKLVNRSRRRVEQSLPLFGDIA